MASDYRKRALLIFYAYTHKYIWPGNCISKQNERYAGNHPYLNMKENEVIDDESLHILSKADQVLAAVDESFIVTKRDHKVRPLPTFRYDEIALGKVLGTGGFGIVYEITNITIDRQANSSNGNCSNESNAPLEGSDQTEPPSSNAVQQQLKDGIDIEHDKTTWQRHEASSTRSISSADIYSNQDSHIHYKVHKAKDWMEKYCCMTSSKVVTSRYALKRLQKGLTAIERSRGMLDLAVEAKYLSIVWHPNISKYISAKWSFFGASTNIVVNSF
jgi:hypothetical protein